MSSSHRHSRSRSRSRDRDRGDGRSRGKGHAENRDSDYEEQRRSSRDDARTSSRHGERDMGRHADEDRSRPEAVVKDRHAEDSRRHSSRHAHHDEARHGHRHADRGRARSPYGDVQNGSRHAEGGRHNSRHGSRHDQQDRHGSRHDAQDRHGSRRAEYDGRDGRRGGDERRHRSLSPADDRHKRGRSEGRPDDHGRNQPGGHHAAALPPPPRLPPASDQPPPLWSIHKGAVHTIRPFGMFVAIDGYKRHVLVHHTQIHDDLKFGREDPDEDKVKSMEFFFPKGQPVWVKVTEISDDPRNPGSQKVCGVMRTVDQDTGEDQDPNNKMVGVVNKGPVSDEPPEVGVVLRGTVKRIEPYGVFVALEGYRKYGLVHNSQVSNYISFSREDTDDDKKAELGGVVTVGESIFVKVVEVIPDDGGGRGPKIQCSIKLVDQKTGEDLDPMNTRYQPRGAGGEGGQRGHGAGIGADAGNVVGGKINWGYIAGETKLHPGDHKGTYSMLDADKAEATGPGRPMLPSNYELKPQGLPAGELLLPPPPALPPPPPKIQSVEEALAILEQAAKSKKKDKGKHKKEKKSKDKKAKKTSKEKSAKKRKRSREDSGSSESSDSD